MSAQACERCVVGCPGLAITLVDYRNNPDYPTISIPYEFNREIIRAQDRVTVLDTEGRSVGGCGRSGGIQYPNQ